MHVGLSDVIPNIGHLLQHRNTYISSTSAPRTGEISCETGGSNLSVTLQLVIIIFRAVLGFAGTRWVPGAKGPV